MRILNTFRFRFGLATLLIVLTVCCVAFGVYMNRVHRQQQAVAQIESWDNGVVFYDFHPSEWNGFFSGGFGQFRHEPEFEKHWLAEYAGDDFVHNVVRVRINPQMVDEAIPVLRMLPGLVEIEVNNEYRIADGSYRLVEEDNPELKNVIERLKQAFPDCHVSVREVAPLGTSPIPVVG